MLYPDAELWMRVTNYLAFIKYISDGGNKYYVLAFPVRCINIAKPVGHYIKTYIYILFIYI